MESEKPIVVIVPGLKGRHQPLIESLENGLAADAEVRVFEHDHLGSVKNRADALAAFLAQLKEQSRGKIVLVGHSLGGYIVKQLPKKPPVPLADAFVGISTPPHARKIDENVARARELLTHLPDSHPTLAAFDPDTLLQNYDFKRGPLRVPSLYLRVSGDRLAMPGKAHKAETGRTSKSKMKFVRVGNAKAPRNATVFDRHNWTHWQPELLQHVRQFLQEQNIVSN